MLGRRRRVVGGREAWYEVRLCPIALPGGTGLLVTSLDVTRAQQVEEELARTLSNVAAHRRQDQALAAASARLAEADRRKDEFLGVLSHELRNPLAPISNALYVLENAASRGEQAARAREILKRQVGQITRLVDDLLDTTRISRGKIELRRTEVDLAALVRRAGEDHRLLLQNRGISFAVEVRAEPLPVLGDEARLSQVVGNLLQNAAKFTPAGGRVTLSAGRAGELAEVRVRDTGSGIEPELLERVFEPFIQEQQAEPSSSGGLGLGLSLVKSLVELHGGRVAAASAGRGQGTEIAVRLPAMRQEVSPAVPDPQRPPASGTRHRVLVVDDNHDAAETLADVVRMLGHEAEVAFDGADALELARRASPDIVFCDIGLPGMSGYEVASAIRSGGETRMRLYAVSGYAQPEDLARAAGAGFDGHLAKPPDLDEIGRLLA